MAKRNNMGRVKHYRRSFYSGDQLVKKIVGMLIFVAAVLAAAWLVAPHILDFGTHTWYTIIRDKELDAASQGTPASSAPSSEAQNASSEPQPEATPEPTAQPLGTEIAEGSWAVVNLSALNSPEAIAQAAASLKEQGVHYALVTLKDTSGYVYYTSTVPSAAGSVAATVVDPAAIADGMRAAGIVPVASIAAFRDPLAAYYDRSMGIHYLGSDYMWLDAANAEAGGKPWLNPYSDTAVAFIGDLIAEVHGFGYDHIVLGNVQFPAAVSAKQDFGDTAGASRAQQLAADIAAWQTRFDGTVTLWYEYPYAACAVEGTTTELVPAALGVKNLLIALPVDETGTDAVELSTTVDNMKALGSEYVVVREGTTAVFH